MSYNKTTWNTGDTITAEKLNNIEGGIENASELYIVNFDANDDSYTISSDKEYADILDAFYNEKLIVAKIHLYQPYDEASICYGDVICFMTHHIEPDTGEIDCFLAQYSDSIVDISFYEQNIDSVTTNLESCVLTYYPSGRIDLSRSQIYLTDEYDGSLTYDGGGMFTYTNAEGENL